MVLAGCGFNAVSVSAGEPGPQPDDWVVITYDVQDEDPGMLKMLRTEMAADSALQAAGAGYIDGNEVGQGTYEMYFVGKHRIHGGKIVKPILDDAPVAWTKAELLDGLDDESPIVIHG